MKLIQSISCYPEVQDGAPVFAGTRIRFETFLDYMRIGFSIREFLNEFPSITPDQAYEAKEIFDSKLTLDQVINLMPNRNLIQGQNLNRQQTAAY